MKKTIYLTILCALVLVYNFQACSKSKCELAPELSNTIVDLRGDTLHLTALSERHYNYVIEANANGVIQKTGKWEKIDTNKFSGNVMLWVCDETVELDESNRIIKTVYDGKIITTGVPKREEYAFTYDDDRIASVKCTTYENDEEISSYESRFTWAHGNLLEIVREGIDSNRDHVNLYDNQDVSQTIKEVYKYGYSKKENPLRTFFTLYAFPICERDRQWGEFGYYGLGTKNLPVIERVYQITGDEKEGEPQLINTKKISIQLDEAGICRALTFKSGKEKATKVVYKYDKEEF